MSTNNFPLVWNSEADDGLLGSLFPQGSNFGSISNSNENIWKEEWKTRTMSEIQDYFFPEAKIRSKNKITICDTTEAFQDIKIENNQTSENAKPLDEIIIETYGVGRIPLDLGNMAIYFFTSSDGARLIRARRCAYESRAKNPDVLAVFMETDEGGNIFGSVMDFVVGDNVRALFKDDYWKKIFDFLENNELHVSRKDTQDLIEKGLSHENFLDYLKRIANDLIAKVSFAVFDAMAEGFGLIAKGIGSWKFKDEEWDAAHENFAAANAPFIFMELDFTQLKKIRYKNSEMFEKIIADFRATVDAHQKKIPDLILKPMQSFIGLLQEKTKLFFKTFEENASIFVNLIRQNNENMNAFLCGFINGFLDFIKSIFDLFAFAFKFAKAATDFALNESYYWNLILEYLENGIDALSKFDILDFFKKTFTLPIEVLAKFMAFLTNLALPSVNLSKIYYFSGYVLLGIVQIVLEIIFTGGSVSIERLFAKSAEIIKGFVKKAGSFADDVFRSLDKLISLIKKGAENFASFIRKIFDDFFEWLKNIFKSGKADEVFNIGKIGSGGFLKYERIISRNMFKQEEFNSCVAACIRQLADDNGIELTEEAVRALAKTTELGTDAPNTAKALINIFENKKTLEFKMFYDPAISDLDALKSISNDGSWITFIRPDAMTKPHAIIIDKIVGNKVLLRDPWPLEAIDKISFMKAKDGIVAEATLEKFVKQWAFGGNYVFKIK